MTHSWSQMRKSVTLAVLVGLAGCRATSLPLWGPAPPAPGTGEVQRVRDVRYWDSPDAEAVAHRLDLYLPKGKSDFPVVVLVHGGEWATGDNRCFGLYASVGEFLARQGIGAVLPNYRLSPWVKHPEHAKDVARAVAWTRKNIAQYGGSANNLFLTGHSAGGHLVALLATDETYLRAEGLQTADIRGVVAVSGVYHIPDDKQDYVLGGPDTGAFRWNNVLPMRGGAGGSASRSAVLPGIPLRLDIYRSAFGSDPQTRRHASPIHHVRPGLPPFLLLSAEHELPTLTEMADEFHQALVRNGCDAQLLTATDRNHNSILFSAIEPADPVARAMVEFVRRHTDR